MGVAIRSELCLGCGLCENVVQDEDILRVTGYGIAFIMSGEKMDEFCKTRKRELIRCCPFSAIYETKGATAELPRAEVKKPTGS